MGLELYKIVFDNPTNTYYAGQTVTGRVIVGLSKPKKVRALKIKFKGAAETKWTEHHDERQSDGSTRSVSDTVTGNETYFDYKCNLLEGSSEVEIPSGKNIYQFSATLPATVPSSFEGEYGFIRYKVKATLDRPWKFDHHTETVFTVVTPLDLNYCEEAKMPVKKEESKRFCCCFCKSGPLTMVLSLPYTGFVAGGTQPFVLEVDNASNVEVSGTKVKILKTVRFKASHTVSQKTSTEKIAKVKLERVTGNNSGYWSQALSIPPDLPFQNLTTCSIIKVEFVLKAVTVVSGAHINFEMDVPLTMGSTPITAPFSAFSPSQEKLSAFSPPQEKFSAFSPPQEKVTPEVPYSIGFVVDPSVPPAPPSPSPIKPSRW